MLFLSSKKNLPVITTDFLLPVLEIAFHGKNDSLIRAAKYLQTNIVFLCKASNIKLVTNNWSAVQEGKSTSSIGRSI